MARKQIPLNFDTDCILCLAGLVNRAHDATDVFLNIAGELDTRRIACTTQELCRCVQAAKYAKPRVRNSAPQETKPQLPFQKAAPQEIPTLEVTAKALEAAVSKPAKKTLSKPKPKEAKKAAKSGKGKVVPKVKAR